MKYKARQMTNGKWAVFTSTSSSKYFIGTVRDTEHEAKVQACIQSADWHHQQMDACKEEWEELQKEVGESHDWQDWENCMA